jgi:hypothetical protein
MFNYPSSRTEGVAAEKRIFAAPNAPQRKIVYIPMQLAVIQSDSKDAMQIFETCIPMSGWQSGTCDGLQCVRK